MSKPRGAPSLEPSGTDLMLNRVLRAGATALHKLLTVGWFFRRPKTYGAHAVALTREGRLVLVKLWYAPGWRLPGGGRDESEPPVDAALRELREEIGMTSHGSAEPACELEEEVDFRRDTCSLIIVRDVEYRPKRWNWEIEAVSEAPLDELPPDLSSQTRSWLREVEARLQRPLANRENLGMGRYGPPQRCP